MSAAVATPVTAQIVANAFVHQYYHILHHSPGLVHRFYQETSKLGRPEEDGSMSITATLEAINVKIMSLNSGDSRAEIKSVDAQDSHNGGAHVLVTGFLTGKLNMLRKFAQTFFLAPQDKGYFVLNDMFRFLDDGSSIAVPDMVTDVTVPASENSVWEEPVAEVHGPPENGVDTIEEEEIPVAEVVDEVQDDPQRVVESITKTEEAPKKSYASIVMHLKENSATFSPPPSNRKSFPKTSEPVNPAVAPSTEEPIRTQESVENENNQVGEDGYSIYIKGLPMTATEALLEEVFRKFGTIKSDGIQVRSNRQQGFCFGFVEFEEASSVQKALEASPVPVGGRQAVVEEKRSTSYRGGNKGRFLPGRGFGFRNDGTRGRGNNYGGRGYNNNNNNNNNRADFSGRNELVNRGYHGTSSSRDGYQRSDNNRNTRSTTPHVSATA